jgi:hypothetical protein
MSAKCPVGYMACGIWNHANGSKGPAYECIDVNSELESCTSFLPSRFLNIETDYTANFDRRRLRYPAS